MPFRVTRSLVPLLAVVLGILAPVSVADPLPEGDVVRVNPDPAGSQGAGGVAMAPDGHFAVAYAESVLVTDQPQVVVRLFGADGTPAPGTIAVNPSSERRDSPSIAMAADGSFVVAYMREASFTEQIRAQRFDAAGTAVGGEIIVSTAGARQLPRVAMAPDGRFAVAWDHAPHVEARLYTADGTPVTGELTVDESGLARFPEVAMDSAGRFVVAWQKSTTFGEVGHVKARRYSATGVPAAGEFDAFTGDLNQPYSEPTVGMDDSGRLVVLVSGTVTTSLGTFSGIYGQRVDATNAFTGEPFRVNESFGSTVLQPGTVVDADGDLLVAFEDQSGGGNKLYLRHYLPDGSADGAPILVGAGAGWNPHARIAVDGAGRAALAFTGNDGLGFNPTGAYTRRLRYAAAPPPGPSPPGTTATPAPSPAPAPAPALQPPVVKLPTFAATVSYPSTRTCVSRRNFRIRIKQPKGGVTITSAEVKVNGKRVRLLKGKRLTAPVDLRTLPKGRFSVAITATTSDGRKISGTRKYRTCVPKKRR